jgi:hypothetical protein
LITNKFLSAVLPTNGYYCVMGLKNNAKPRQKFVSTIEELEAGARELLDQQYDAYFGLASFTDNKAGRVVSNASALNSFFLDLDCGTGKPYADQAEGIDALRKFVKELELPKPTIVNSGRGVHAYWTLTEPVTPAVWKPIAESLKSLCDRHKLYADPVVTADVARILRVPGTKNFKNFDNPLDVVVLLEGAPVELEVLKAKFNFVEDVFASMGAVPEHLRRELDPTTKLLMSNHQYKFKTILELSIQEKGCAQILHAYNNQETIEEPLWRAALSIAVRCEDKEKAIRFMSNKHPDYSEQTARNKADSTKGPYTCSTYKKINPSGCAGCPHKIGTPLQLGAELIEAPAIPQIVVEENANGTVRQFEVPDVFPFPYVKGANSGVYIQFKDEEGNKVTELVYPYYLYAVSHIEDPDQGHTLLIRLHLPKGGVKEFLMPFTTLMSKDRFRDKIAENGVVALNKEQDNLMRYIAKWAEHLQSTTAPDKARRQFGWTDDDTGFIIGDKEVTATDVLYSPPTASTLTMVPMFGTKGDFHTWKDVVNAYSREHMEARAFAFFMGFGNVLLKFTALEGYMLSLRSQKSGTGKTTILSAIASIYGNPKEGWMMLAKDTHNHKIQRTGTLRNVPVLFDEMTQLSVEDMSNLIYDITQGRGKNRMKSAENAERLNLTKWSTGIIATTNRSVPDALMSMKAMPEGELMRVMELQITKDPLDNPAWSRQHFAKLNANYGHAITPFLQYLLNNLPQVIDFVEQIQQKIERAANMHTSERFWAIQAALAISAGIITRKLGLHDIDHRPVLKYIVNHIISSRAQNEKLMEEGSDFLGNLIQRRFHEILVINGKKDSRTGLEHGPIREPRGSLTARYEPDTKILYISSKEYRTECNKWKVNFDESLDQYKKLGAFMGMKRKRMSSGTNFDADVNIHALWFDTSKLDFFNEESIVNVENTERDIPDTVE